MIDLNNTYIKENVIYSKGRSHEGYSFIKYFLKENNEIKSFLDIGCGNGILLCISFGIKLYFLLLCK